MSHYYLNIPVNSGEVKIIKEHLTEYLDKSDGLDILVSPRNELIEIPEQLEVAIKILFIRLLIHIGEGEFKGLN